MHASLRFFALASLAASSAAQINPVPASVILNQPCNQSGADYGQSTCVFNFDGVGALEVAVGAYDHGRVFVHHDVTMSGDLGGYQIYNADGPTTCSGVKNLDRFGYDVAAGNLDGDPLDELVVGAPESAVGPQLNAGRVYIFRHPGDTNPTQLRELEPENSWFGESVAVGDLNHDGFQDIAVAAPKSDVGGVAAGSTHIFYGPFDVLPPSIEIDNPQPVQHGNFGQHLSIGDVTLDGIDDLVVSAIGNSNAAGLAVAGQIYVYPGPVDPAVFSVVEDPVPDPQDLPGPRFGMHIDARDGWVLVGANRKDWLGIHDAGMGFCAPGNNTSQVTLLEYPDPGISDYMGFRCAVADVIGDSTPDLTYVIMGKKRQLVTWDGDRPFGPPAYIRRTRAHSADHWGNGLVAAQLIPGGKEEFIVGDPTYDKPGTGVGNNTGRVVIYSYER